MNTIKRFPSTIKKFKNMSKRERTHLIYSNILVRPTLYALSSFLLFFVTIWADLKMELGSEILPVFTSDYQLTKTILSTLTGGLLSLTSFTFYGVLTALTTFSGQYSPRILKNFMMTKVTQRTLSIFNGSFIYVLLCLLFLNNEETLSYFFIPTTATLLAALSLASFAIFINHIVTWLQVAHMTGDMKWESIRIIEKSMLTELDPYKVENEESVKNQVPENQGHQVMSNNSGYLQTINFDKLMEEALEDDLIIKLEYKVGNFVFGSTPLITYWKNNNIAIDENKYKDMLHIGKSQTEIQDIEFSINKFVEITIRSLGNHDPKTASGTLYEIGDLLINISKKVKFTPYLTDESYNLRLIIQNYTFEDYLYIGFASIRHYARDNVIVTVELLKVLDAIAQGIHSRDHQPVWDFVEYVASGFEYEYMHDLDRKRYYKALNNIAETTGNNQAYHKLIKRYHNELNNNSVLK
ncbi:DUF2254 domain-containing protein [Aquibacillus saliphilus]|uniref:DUF2254 domain-containing protein n=1 Tax=Aquibacillus saliphilus TaxID=1909422 RepID=UPI001CF0AA2E|nr:DUF2254 domain-containing protein [Aquibacillus saliphilus]